MAKLEPGDVRAASDRALNHDEITVRLVDLPGWVLEGKQIRRQWSFRDHYQAIAFVNAVAWISHQTDHHPDMHVGYNKVSVTYSTHSSGGVSEKDLLCAAKVSRL